MAKTNRLKTTPVLTQRIFTETMIASVTAVMSALISALWIFNNRSSYKWTNNPPFQGVQWEFESPRSDHKELKCIVYGQMARGAKTLSWKATSLLCLMTSLM